MSWTSLRVPASSANLGPGFDALGLALGIYLDCRFRPSDKLSSTVTGRDWETISTGEDNLIWQTALAVAADTRSSTRPIELQGDTQIPVGKGLGSSAAALTAGVVIADRLLGLGWKRPRILDEAARIEGHPDNVAACVLGSLVASAIDSGGGARAVRLELSSRFGIGIVVPDFMLPTVKARAVLPDCYSRTDAIFNVQRAALLVAALATGTVGAFPTALEDRLHQSYRAHLAPRLSDLLKLQAPGLLGCALSGSGPSIIVLYERGCAQVWDMLRRVLALHGHTSEALLAPIAEHGFTLEEGNDAS